MRDAGRPALRPDPRAARRRRAPPSSEPPQSGARTATLQLEVQIPIVVGGYHIPAAADPDVPALEVLAAILSAGESSRLHQRLVRNDHLAIAAGGVDRVAGGSGAVHRLRRLPARSRRGRCSSGAGEEIARVRDQPVEARRARQGQEPAGGGFVFGLQTVDGIAPGAGRGAVRRGRLAPLPRGGDALPGGHRGRRAAGGAQVPRRRQPHAGDARPRCRRPRGRAPEGAK